MLVCGFLVTPNNTKGSWRGDLCSIPSPTMVVWLIDGNNLSCARKVPNERETILRELTKIASPIASISGDGNGIGYGETSRSTTTTTAKPMPISNVVVVFDGNEDETSDTTTIEKERWFEWTVTDGRGRLPGRADDWIVRHSIPKLRKTIEERVSGKMGSARVNLVSADKELRKRVRATGIMNGGSFIHPPKFWNEYLPVLQEQQRRQQNEQRQP